MTVTATSTVIPFAAVDVYKMTASQPTHVPAPPLPHDLHALGMQIPGNRHYTVHAPAVDAYVLILQLVNTTAMLRVKRQPRNIIMGPGDVGITPPGVSGFCEVQTGGASNVLLIALPPRLLQRTAESEFDGYSQQAELPECATAQPDPLMLGIGWALQRQLQAQGTWDKLYVESLVAMMAVHVLRTYAVAGRPLPQRMDRILSPAALRRVYEYIEAHLEGALTLEELSQVAQYSPYHLARLFRAATGQTLHQYVMERRLAKARLLLQTTDLPLQQIAHQAGFTDQSHFSKCYRRVYGHAPGAGRKGERAPRP